MDGIIKTQILSHKDKDTPLDFIRDCNRRINVTKIKADVS